MNLTGKNEWNPTSVLLGYTVSINRIEPKPGFKEKMLTLLPQNIAQTTRFGYYLEDLHTRQIYYSPERHTKISAEVISEIFGIGIELSNANLKETLQRDTISDILSISRRYRADRQYGVNCLKGKYSTNTLWGKSKYLRSNAATEVYIHKCEFITVYHTNKANNKNTGQSLGAFISEYGVPEHMNYDGAAIQVGSKTIFQIHVRKHEIKTH